jgi:acetyl esterase
VAHRAFLHALDVVGRRLGTVGIAGRSREDVVAARGRRGAAPLERVGERVFGRAPASLRRHEARTGSGVPLVVVTPPHAPGTVLPVVVHVHGGGWVYGDVEQVPWWVGEIAAGLPAVVVMVDYRLSPEHPFPAALDDVVDAMRWVAAHPHHVGAQARVRTDRLALAGDSAGGNLVAAATLELRDRPEPGDPELVHQVLVYPAVDATLSSPSVARHAHAPFLTRADMVTFVDFYTRGPGGETLVDVRDPRLSPLHADDLSGLPPATVITASDDPLRDDGERYAARLRAAGVPVRWSDYPGAVHGFVSTPGLDPVRSRHAVTEMLAELRLHLPLHLPLNPSVRLPVA